MYVKWTARIDIVILQSRSSEHIDAACRWSAAQSSDIRDTENSRPHGQT